MLTRQPDKPSYEHLVAENARLRQQVADLAAKLEAALAENARLKRSGKCREYVALLRQAEARISMSGKGRPRDNAQAESFMRTLKHEEGCDSPVR